MDEFKEKTPPSEAALQNVIHQQREHADPVLIGEGGTAEQQLHRGFSFLSLLGNPSNKLCPCDVSGLIVA